MPSRQPREFWVYILADSKNRTLYVGVTSDLQRRIEEHRSGVGSRFVSRYKIHKLVYAEAFDNAFEAITREKQLKGGSRGRKIELINTVNPQWLDLMGPSKR